MQETTRSAGRRAHHAPSDDPLTKAQACDVIAARMSGRPWDAECAADVADTLRRAGFTVRETDEQPEPAPFVTSGCTYCGAEFYGTGDDCGGCRLEGDDLERYARSAARPFDPRADAPEGALNARDVQELSLGSIVPNTKREADARAATFFGFGGGA